MSELPSISNFANVSSCYIPTITTAGTSLQQLQQFQNVAGPCIDWSRGIITESLTQEDLNPIKETKKKMAETKSTKRIVRVFIVDTDDNVPLSKAVLYESEEKLTDLTEQELFLEIGIKQILDDHNEYRTKVLDKKATAKAGRDVFLEAIRIRDLKMVVSTVAEF